MTVPVNRGIFRTYDIRGIADRDLPDEVVRPLARAVARALGGRGRVAVGGDVRISTPRIHKAFLEGLLEAGMDALDVGIGSTPMVYFAAHRWAKDLAGAVAVTASHNPPEYNGFKMLKGTSALFGDEIQALADDMENEASPSPAGRRGHVEAREIRAAYIEDLVGRIRLDRRIKVVVDAGNGAAGLVAPEVYRRLGCEVIELYCTPDGTFPNHEADPTVPEALEDLRDEVVRRGADLGIAFDGDGDRIGVVDETGRIAWGDQLMAIYFREVLAAHPGAPCIIEVKCSQALVEEVERLGGKPFFYRTGHSLIKAKMKELKAPFTGEMSGHMFFADEFPGYDDAVYAGARLLRILARSSESFGAHLDRVPTYEATPELRVDCPDEEKFAVVEAFVAAAKRDFEVITVDGGRLVDPDGWGLVRASNTGPKIIVRTEGKTREARDRILRYIRDRLGVHRSVDLSSLDKYLRA